MVDIRPIAAEDIAGFNAAVDAVAREKRFLGATEGPPMAASEEFVRTNLAKGNPQFVAVDGLRLVGWCDIVRIDRQPMYRHRGTLGVGLLQGWRGRGIGRLLIERAIDAARAADMTRIELTVRCDNETAIRLYEKVGFRREGYHRGTDRIDGVLFDTLSMALIA